MRELQPADISRAKLFMGHGLSMTECARALGINPADLDKALWQYLGVKREDIVPTARGGWRPDF